MRKPSPRRQLIDVLAKRWAARRYGGPDAMRPFEQAIAAYMRNWLAQQGSLPTGTHNVGVRDRSVRFMADPERKTTPMLVVDFDRLRSDPNYPEGIMQEYRHGLFYTFQPGDRAVFDDYKDRTRYGLRGTVVESSGVTHGWAVVDLDNGEQGVRVDGGTILKKIGKAPS